MILMVFNSHDLHIPLVSYLKKIKKTAFKQIINFHTLSKISWYFSFHYVDP